MAIHSGRTLALSEFLAALEERLERLAPGELCAVLLAHAQRLPARDRQAFLGIFPGGPDAAARPARARDADRPDPAERAILVQSCSPARLLSPRWNSA
jgi:hypothetical protein